MYKNMFFHYCKYVSCMFFKSNKIFGLISKNTKENKSESIRK